VLRACWRVLRPGGRIAFYTIHIPPDTPPADYRRTARARSPGLASWRRAQTDLLRAAGFTGIEEIDATPEFLDTTHRWLAARTRHADELSRSEGREPLLQRLRDNRATIRAIQAGLLRRSLFLARRPH
jgi:SAM-dependent methyltransferase